MRTENLEVGGETRDERNRVPYQIVTIQAQNGGSEFLKPQYVVVDRDFSFV